MDNNVNKEYIAYIEPNVVRKVDIFDDDDKIYPLTPKYEDMNVLVDLEIEVRSRFIDVQGDDTMKKIRLSFMSSPNDTTMSLFQGSKILHVTNLKNRDSVNSLTTRVNNDNYLDMMSGEGYTTELFGIRSIDINYGNYLTPQVTIQFTDIRGGSLFAKEEAARDLNGVMNSENIEPSFFRCFFSQPYPKFRLLIKGFYGKPVVYDLTCSTFKAKFNSSTGNFDATVNFVSYAFSILNDISLNAMCVAPDEPNYGSGYWENANFTFSNGQRIPKMYDIISSLRNMKITAATRADFAQIQTNQTRIDTCDEAIRLIGEYTKEVYNAFINVNNSGLPKRNHNDGTLVTLSTFDGNGIEQISTFAAFDFRNKINAKTLRFDAYFSANTSIIDYERRIESTLNAIDPTLTKIMTYASRGGCYSNKNVIDRIYSAEAIDHSNGKLILSSSVQMYGLNDNLMRTLKSAINKVDYGVENGYGLVRILFIYSSSKILNALVNKRKELVQTYEASKSDATERIKSAFRDSLGFELTIYNVIKLLISHMETLLYCIDQAAQEAKGVNRTPQTLGLDEENSDTNGNYGDKVPPFPKVTVPDSSADGGIDGRVVETWIGSLTNDITIAPEIKLIDGLLDAVTEYNSKMSEALANLEAVEERANAISLSVVLPTCPLDLTLNSDEDPFFTFSESKLNGTTEEIINELSKKIGARAFNSLRGLEANSNMARIMGIADAINVAEKIKTPSNSFINVIKNQDSNQKAKFGDVSDKTLINRFLNLRDGNKLLFKDTSLDGAIQFSENYWSHKYNNTYLHAFPLYGKFSTLKDAVTHIESRNNVSFYFDNDIVIKFPTFNTLQRNKTFSISKNKVIEKEGYDALFYPYTEKNANGEDVNIFSPLQESLSCAVFNGEKYLKCFEDVDDEILNKKGDPNSVTIRQVIENDFNNYEQYYPKTFKHEKDYDYRGYEGKKYDLFVNVVGTNINDDPFYKLDDINRAIIFLRSLPITKNVSDINNIFSGKDGEIVYVPRALYLLAWDFYEYMNDDPTRPSHVTNIDDFLSASKNDFFAFVKNIYPKISELSKYPKSWNGEEWKDNECPEIFMEISNLLFKPYMIRVPKRSERTFVNNFESYFSSFVETLKKNYEKEINKQMYGDTKENIINSDNNDDVRIALYKYCKSVYDKWLCGTPFERWREDWFFDEHFYFIDSFYNKLGDICYINAKNFVETLVYPRMEQQYSLLSFISNIAAQNNFLFLYTNKFVDLLQQGNMDKMFLPLAYEDIEKEDINIHPDFVFMYAGEPSRTLDCGDNAEFKDDSFMLNGAALPVAVTRTRIGTSEDNNWFKIPAFGVSYGKMYQSYFTDIDVSSDSPITTEQAIKAKFAIAGSTQEAENGNEEGTLKSSAFLGQDLYTVYANNSYTCNVTMMGCPWVQPLMYFVLTNIPMFRGSYLIEKVSHHIEPGNMTTQFTGVRMANVSTPFVKHESVGVSADNEYAEYVERQQKQATIENDCEYKVFPLDSDGEVDGMPLSELERIIKPSDAQDEIYNTFKGHTIHFVLAAGVYGEAKGEDALGKKLVATCMFNRWKKGGLKDYLLKISQFNAFGDNLAKSFRLDVDNDAKECYDIIQEVFTKGPTYIVGEKAIPKANHAVQKPNNGGTTTAKVITLDDAQRLWFFNGYGLYNSTNENSSNAYIKKYYAFQHGDHVFAYKENNEILWQKKEKKEGEKTPKIKFLVEAIQNTFNFTDGIKDTINATYSSDNKKVVLRLTNNKNNAQLFDVVLNAYYNEFTKLVWHYDGTDKSGSQEYPDDVWIEINEANGDNKTPTTKNVTIKYSGTLNNFNGTEIYDNGKSNLPKQLYKSLSKKYNGEKVAAIKREVTCLKQNACTEEYINKLFTDNAPSVCPPLNQSGVIRSSMMGGKPNPNAKYKVFDLRNAAAKLDTNCKNNDNESIGTPLRQCHRGYINDNVCGKTHSACMAGVKNAIAAGLGVNYSEIGGGSAQEWITNGALEKMGFYKVGVENVNRNDPNFKILKVQVGDIAVYKDPTKHSKHGHTCILVPNKYFGNKPTWVSDGKQQRVTVYQGVHQIHIYRFSNEIKY